MIACCCIVVHFSDIPSFVKQLWRQLLRSRERSCGGCERKLPSGGGIGWEELCEEELRDMCKAAGLPVRANSSKKWLAMPELREVLLADLFPDLKLRRRGSGLMASYRNNMCNGNEGLFLLQNMFQLL